MTTTAHSVAPEDIMAFLDGELSASEARAVSAHVKDCAQCAMVAEQFRATSRLLSRWDVPAVSVELEDTVRSSAAKVAVGHRTVKAGAFFRGSTRRWRPLMIRGGGLAAAALVTFVGLWAVRPRSSPPSANSIAINSNGNFPMQAAKKREQRGEPLHALDSRAVAGVAGMGSLGSVIGGIATPESAAGNLGLLEASATPAPMIARSASLVIRVKDVEASRSSLDSILARHHGYPAQLNVNSPEYGPRGFQASLRIPEAELLSAVGEIKGLGRLENESQSGEDVTRQHTDVAARLKTARETEERFRAILQQRTGKISDVLEVERSIARVRGEIESMEAEQKALEHRVDFASVEIQLSEEYKAQLSSPDSVSVRINNAFVAGYHNATETLLGFVLFFEEYGPSLVIWLVVLALPILLVWRRYKRLRSTI
jgi:anti-sigma factor RsiW